MEDSIQKYPGESKRLLFIEDSDDQWLLFQKALEQVNPQLDPVRVSNQQEAIAFLKEGLQKEAEFPQLILLDLYLPRRKDGWQTLEAIQKLLPTTKQVPIVILSASTDLEDVIDANQMGIRSYVIKPKTFPQLLETCQILNDYLLERSRNQWNTVQY